PALRGAARGDRRGAGEAGPRAVRDGRRDRRAGEEAPVPRQPHAGGQAPARRARAGAGHAGGRPPAATHARAAAAGGPDPARPPVGPRARTRIAAPPEPATEASSGSVQALMLGLGALLLGIAAVVFVGVAITVLDVWGQLAILVAATVVALALPLPLARGGLISTAETVSAVGLVLVSVVGYALWATGTVAALPVQTFAGLVAAGTAAAGYGYHRLTGLAAARSAGLLAVQPVL